MPVEGSVLVIVLVVLVTAAFCVGCGHLVRLLTRRLRSVFAGERAQGRCVRRFSSESSDGTTYWHHVYGFEDAQGQWVEFQEDAMFMALDQAVTVRYQRRDPKRTATVIGPGGAWSPLFGLFFGIFITGVFSALGLLMSYLLLTQ
ncbi:hypothetical protein ACWCP6_05310 [Streptomyces sp. NPDC002004]